MGLPHLRALMGGGLQKEAASCWSVKSSHSKLWTFLPLADQCEALGAVHVVQVCACEPQGEGKVLYPTQTLTLILTLSLALSLTLSLTLTLS